MSVDWLIQVERFFALLTDWQFHQRVHRSIASLSDAITGFIDQHNADPKPFRWTNTADGNSTKNSFIWMHACRAVANGWPGAALPG